MNSHLRELIACVLSDDDYPDGVTAEIVEKLRSKKTAQKTEAERWQDIYKLLFPDEMVPSPCKSPPSHFFRVFCVSVEIPDIFL